MEIFPYSTLNAISGVSSQFDTSNRERSVDEELLECSPRYVALKDLFLPQEEIKLTITNHRHASIYEFALAPSYSCEDGSYLENRAGEYDYDERTGEPYAKPKRLDFSDIERNGTCCDLDQDDENEDDLHTQSFRRIESNDVVVYIAKHLAGIAKYQKSVERLNQTIKFPNRKISES
ncbi:titin-like isoform X3 [Vespula squamosa]|uniref:Titin-like isoform X3 n=1 Tax=Vespula squamosa TaxID=30214 RepID=A0ABD2B9R8_VESSQ